MIEELEFLELLKADASDKYTYFVFPPYHWTTQNTQYS